MKVVVGGAGPSPIPFCFASLSWIIMHRLLNYLSVGLLFCCFALAGCGSEPAVVELGDAEPDPIAISPEKLRMQTEEGEFTPEQ
jgi:hypothetical protein